MRGLTTPVILIVALAGLGGYIYFVENKKPAVEADAKAKAFAVTADDIQEIQINVASGDKTRAQRADTTWKLVEPVEAEGNSSELSNMASSLAALDVQRVVDESPSDLAQFGLEPPKIEIEFKAKGQSQPMRLQVGDKTPTGGDVYAKKPGENRVFLVTASLNDTFNRSAFDLRDKTVLRFERDKVDGLEIVRGNETLQFARNGADWAIVKPAAMRADYAAIEGLVTSLSSTLMQKFVASEATPAELRTYGLDKPATSASVVIGADRVTLMLGKTDNAETYARTNTRPAVVMVAPTIVSDLAKPVSEFRRKDLFDLRSFSTKRIELTRGADMFVFEKSTDKDGKDTWKGKNGAMVDTTRVEDLLTKLSNLRAVTFEDKVDPALNTPALSVTATFGENKDQNRSETVRITKSGASAVASRAGEPGAVTIDNGMFDEAMKALDALK